MVRVGVDGGSDGLWRKPVMADTLSRSRHWAQRTDPRAALRTALVWEGLDPLIAALTTERPE
jgi:hypothetical protein